MPKASVLLVAGLLMAAAVTPAVAQNNDSSSRLGDAIANIIIGSINQARLNRVTRTWANVDPDVQKCLADHYNTPVADLQRQYIGADDARLREPIASCTQIVEQQHQQAAANESARQAAAVADAHAREEAAAAQEAQAAARRASLTQRYGPTTAAAILSGQVSNGMTPDQVRSALGEPRQIEQLTPADAIWHYSSSRVYVSNGRVVGVRRLN